MLKRKHIVALLFLVLSFGTSYSQLYPVQVTPQLIPPYSLQVSEYYSPTSLTSSKLNLLLLLRDVTKPQMRVRLRMTIESQGVSIKTREDIAYTPITIYSGEPKYVQPAELAEYFAPNNIEISGLSPQDYQTTGRLPEGYYTFCFQLVDIASGQTVSNKGCAYAWMAASEPPFLVLPNKGEAITPVNPQNLFFQWTPRQGANPNAYQNVEYVFTLKEITDSTVSPEAAFFTSPIFFADTVTNTNQAYTPSYPQLIPGRNYAWQVQVRTQAGRDPVQFKNNGYSEISWFQYKNDCPQLTAITATVRGQQTTIQWQPNARHLEYQLNYREANNAGAEWFSVTNTKPSVTIRDLKVGKTYEYKVGSACETSLISFNPPGNFTTSADSTISTITQCGVLPALNDTASNNLLASLAKDDIIKAGDYNVKVIDASGGNGVFSGTGYTPISWLGDMNIAVKFDNVTINAAYQLVRGRIQTTYDPTEGGIASVNELIDVFVAGYGVGSVVSGLPSADTTVPYIIAAPANIAFAPGTGYDQNTGIGPATLTITNASGQTVGTITTNKLPITIQDQLGNIYQVAKDGAVTKIGSAGGSVLLKTLNAKQLDADKAVVKFIHHPSEVYAFDEFKEAYKKSGTFLKEYERLGTDYYVSAKAIAPGKTDVLRAQVTIKDNTIIADSIKFISGKGVLYDSKKITEGVYDINIIGGPEKDAQEIYAVYKTAASKTMNLGKVLVASYPRKEYNVKLVNVNSSVDLKQAVEQNLNSIYGKLNISFNVENSSTPLNYGGWDLGEQPDGKLQIKQSGNLSAVTSEMAALSKYYFSKYRPEPNTITLFVLNESDSASVMGVMPRGRSFGFLFTQGFSASNIGKTAAHEIGHGAFALRHTFDYGFAQGALSDNLMDYPNGNSLAKHQWDMMFDPAIVLGIFEKEERAWSNGPDETKKINKESQLTSYYIDPQGRFLDLDALGNDVILSPACYTTDNKDGKLFPYVIGHIYYNGLWYNATYDKLENGKFQGYIRIAADKSVIALPVTNYFLSSPSVGKIRVINKGNQDCYYGYQDIDNWNPSEVADKTVDEIVDILNNKLRADKWSSKLFYGKTSASAECHTQILMLDASALKDTVLPNAIKNSFLDLITTGGINELTGQIFIIERRILFSYKDPSKNAKQVTMVDGVLKIGNDIVDASGNQIVIWVEIQDDQSFVVKDWLIGSYFNDRWKDKMKDFIDAVDWNQKTVWERFNTQIKGIKKDGIKFVVSFCDWLASGVRYLRIPERYYDCTSSEYNATASNIMKAFTEAIPSSKIVNYLIDECKRQGYFPANANVNDESIKIAFTIGLYNGLVEVVASAPELVGGIFSMLDEDNLMSAIEKTKNFITDTLQDENGKTICLPKEQLCKLKHVFSVLLRELKNQYLNQQRPCFVAHNIGEVVGPIIVACFGDEAAVASVASKFSSSLRIVLKVFKYCDDLGPSLFNYFKVKTGLHLITTPVGNFMAASLKSVGSTVTDIIKPVYDNATQKIKYYVLLLKEGESLPRLVTLEQEELVSAMSTIENGGNGTFKKVLNGDNSNYKLVFATGKAIGDYLVEKTGLQLSQIARLLEVGFENSHILALAEELKVQGFADNIFAIVRPNRLEDALLSGADAKQFAIDLVASVEKNGKEGLKEFLGEATSTNLAARVKAWQALNKAGKKELKFKKETLAALENVMSNSKLRDLGITIEDFAKIDGAAGLAYHEILDNLDNFGKNIAKKNITIQDFDKLMSEFFEGSGKRDGANWIVKYLGDYAGDFEGKTLKFEAYYSNSLGGRYVDVSDITNNSEKIFYEFKSVLKVPPGDFSEQFMKDLTNAKNLSDIKWIFNSAKNPANFQQNLINAINDLPLTNELARKFIPSNPSATISDLKDLLGVKFNQIFKLI